MGNGQNSPLILGNQWNLAEYLQDQEESGMQDPPEKAGPGLIWNGDDIDLGVQVSKASAFLLVCLETILDQLHSAIKALSPKGHCGSTYHMINSG